MTRNVFLLVSLCHLWLKEWSQRYVAGSAILIASRFNRGFWIEHNAVTRNRSSGWQG